MSPGGQRSLLLRRAVDVQPKSPRWLWGGRIPLGSVSLIAGREGLGKSTVTIHVGSRASRGELPGDLEGKPGHVIFASAEDSAESTLLPRLLAAGADLDQVSLLDVFIREGAEELPGALTLPNDTEALGEAIRASGARMLVLDPLVSYLPGDVNAHRDQHVRRVLAPLARLADDHDLAIVAVVHLNKGETTDVLARVGGSVGFTAAARSVLVFGRDPDDPDGESGASRILAHAKCNVGPLAPSIRARIEPRTVDTEGGEAIATSRVVLLDETEETARDLLTQPATSDEQTARAEAAEFLRAELERAPMPAKLIRAAAHDAGIADRTLDRAKKAAGVRARKRPEGWVWELINATYSPNGGDGVVGVVGALDKDAMGANGASAYGTESR